MCFRLRVSNWSTIIVLFGGKIQAWSAVDLFWVCHLNSLTFMLLKKKKKRENTALKYSDRNEEEKRDLLFHSHKYVSRNMNFYPSFAEVLDLANN